MRHKVISKEEYEYQAMCGSTNDAFVFGVGHVQCKPQMVLSARPDPMGALYNQNSWHQSLYMTPKLSIEVSDDESEYREALEDTIKSLMTDGRVFWDPINGQVHPVGFGTNIDVKVSTDYQVTISYSGQSGERHLTYNMTISLEHLMNAFQYSADIAPTAIVTKDAERGMTIKTLDWRNIAKKAKSVSSLLMTAYKPLQGAYDRMELYSKMPSLGGTKLVNLMELSPSPVQKAFPKAFIGIEMSNSTIIKWGQRVKMAGRTIGGFGLLTGSADMAINGLSWSNGLYTGLSAVAFIFPATQAAIGVYFISDLAIMFLTSRTIGEHIDYYSKEENRREFAETGVMGILENSPATKTWDYICKVAELYKTEMRVGDAMGGTPFIIAAPIMRHYLKDASKQPTLQRRQIPNYIDSPINSKFPNSKYKSTNNRGFA